MAEFQGVWGIDIGQAGLKAVRLRYAEAAGQVIAVAFDYVPHAKILSQPDAVPHELIAQSLDTFLSRNELKGDRVAIAVPGNTALARFIQLPPVESGKVSEIVKYEARQQIPFALEDVIWDFQTIGNPVVESGYMLGAEVGLFAMKRDQVMQHLNHFLDSKIEVELVQIAPLGVFNVLCYDQMGLRAGEEPVPSDKHTIALDMGTDNTTLVISNGEKIWIRNVPIGGNHFTRALTKGMKLTFAKAEHLKCNATKSPDPRAVFQALRPVFNDYVSEIQRSIGYFSSVNRDAVIGKVIGLGNGFKLAGLQKFLHQNLQYEVERIESFDALVGDTVLSAPLFQENIMSFVVPYGVALQALGLTHVRTTLLPSEIAAARTIRQKKPWAVVAAASMLLGLSLSTLGYSNVASSVSTDRFGEAEQKSADFTSEAGGFKSSFDGAIGEHNQLVANGESLLKPFHPVQYWAELYRAINECLPRDTGDAKDEDDITLRHRIHITEISAKKYASPDAAAADTATSSASEDAEDEEYEEDEDEISYEEAGEEEYSGSGLGPTAAKDLAGWFAALKEQQRSQMLPQDQANPPSGEGYIVTLVGHHYHDEPSDPQMRESLYVRNALLNNLAQPMLQQPNSPQPVPVRLLGITHATVITSETNPVPYNPMLNKLNEAAQATAAAPGPFRGLGARQPAAVANPREELTSAAPKTRIISRTSFVVQFVWKPTPPEQRQAGFAASQGEQPTEATETPAAQPAASSESETP